MCSALVLSAVMFIWFETPAPDDVQVPSDHCVPGILCTESPSDVPSVITPEIEGRSNVQKVYKHYKGGLYVKLFDARDASNRLADWGPSAQAVIVYMSLDGERRGQIWTRCAREFEQEVRWPDGSVRARFIRWPTED